MSFVIRRSLSAQEIASVQDQALRNVATPSAPSGVPESGVTAGSLANGTYTYKVVFVLSDGSVSLPSAASSNVVVSGGPKRVTLTLPVSTDPRVTGRRVFRTTPSNPTPSGHSAPNGPYHYSNNSGAHTVNDNTTTTLIDGVQDQFCTVREPYDSTAVRSWRLTGSTLDRTGYFGETTTVIGYRAGIPLTTVNGGFNLQSATIIGANACAGLVGTNLSGGAYNGTVAVGAGVLASGSNADIQTSVLIGTNVAATKTTGSQCVAIGTAALSGASNASIRFCGFGTHAGIAYTTGGSYSILVGNYCGDERGGGTGTLLSSAAAASQIGIGYALYLPSVNNIGIIGSQHASGYIDALYLGSGYEISTPRAITVSGTRAVGSNVSGSTIRVQGGVGTGSAVGGSVALSASPAGGAGSTDNAAVDWLTLDGRGFLTLVNTAAADVATPAAGSINLFLDSADGAFKYRNSAGTVKVIQVV